MLSFCNVYWFGLVLKNLSKSSVQEFGDSFSERNGQGAVTDLSGLVFECQSNNMNLV